MVNSPPPSKRHITLLSHGNSKPSSSSSTISTISSSSSSSSQSNSSSRTRISLVFMIACLMSLILQLFGTFVSWQDHELASSYTSSTQLNTMPKPSKEGRRLTSNDKKKKHQQPQPKSYKGINMKHSSKSRALSSLDNTATTTTTLSDGAYQNDHDSMSVLPVNRQYGAPAHSRRLRVLFGVLTGDFRNDCAYRKRHRALFELWKDPRVCSLPDFKSMPLEERYRCEIIYTFVIGANVDAPPSLVDESRPYEVDRPISGICSDLNEPDMTLLNIRENMNEGKSQTWMYYGSKIAQEYDLDYVAKCDADSILHLHDFFQFAYSHLPPAPYNRHVYVGALRDKAYWPRHPTEKERIRFESYFGNNFEGVHLYVAGQLYIVSTDLARFIGEEALANKCSYCEGHEDHDISAMAFHSPDPIKLVVIGRNQRFWEHPVKGEPRWKRIWARENARMTDSAFEGRKFKIDSTFDTVYRKA